MYSRLELKGTRAFDRMTRVFDRLIMEVGTVKELVVSLGEFGAPAAVSKQHERLMAAVEMVPMSTAQAARLLEKVKEIPFSDPQMSTLASQISIRTSVTTKPRADSSSGGSGSGIPMQDWCLFAAYPTQEAWDDIMAPGGSLVSKIGKVATLVVANGLRYATEPTIARLASIALLASMTIPSWESVRALDPAARADVFLNMKSEFKRVVKLNAYTKPREWIDKLPPNVETFKDVHPETYAAWYPEGKSPVPSRISWTDLSKTVAMIPMRKTHRDIAQQSPMQLALQAIQMQAMGRAGAHSLHTGLQLPCLMDAKGASKGVLARVKSRCMLALEDAGTEAPGVASSAQQVEMTASAQMRTEDRRVAESYKADSNQIPLVHGMGSKSTADLQVEGSSQADAGENQTGRARAWQKKSGPKPACLKKSVVEASDIIAKALDERAVMRKRPAAATPQDETAVKKVKAASTPMKKHPSSPEAAMPTPPKPFFGVERSRKQVMCRSGLPGPGQCFAIKFGAAGEAAAVKKAEAWLQRELRKVK